jgi:hypothetical protein
MCINRILSDILPRVTWERLGWCSPEQAAAVVLVNLPVFPFPVCMREVAQDPPHHRAEQGLHFQAFEDLRTHIPHPVSWV